MAFDQPDVEASKVATRKLTEEYERSGSLPAETPFFEGEGVKLFADERNAQDLNATVNDRSLSGYVKAHLDRLQPGDRFLLDGRCLEFCRSDGGALLFFPLPICCFPAAGCGLAAFFALPGPSPGSVMS